MCGIIKLSEAYKKEKQEGKDEREDVTILCGKKEENMSVVSHRESERR